MEWRQSLHPEYEVSDDGRLRALVARYRRPVGTVVVGATKKGYQYYSLIAPGEMGRGAKRMRFYAHTAVLTAFVGPRPAGKQGAHWDGDGLNNNLSNLRWATAAENTADKVRHGRHREGHRKYTDEDVLEMRRLREEGSSYHAIMVTFGVSKGNLSAIINRKTWGHI